jgi:hypothetical protein
VTAPALLCALLAASPGARSAAAFVPARVDAAVLVDGSQGAAGLRAFFGGVSQRAPALAPGPRLAALVGPDLLAQPVSWGLAFGGPRAVVLLNGSVGLTAPVRDAKAARSALQSWLNESGPVRPLRTPPLRGALAAGEGRRARAGMVSLVAGGLRLLTASGPQAAPLLAALSHVGGRTAGTAPLSADLSLRGALAPLTGPAALIARGPDPVRATALSLEGSAQGLVAKGLVLASAALLGSAAPGPSACAGAALFCLRAGLGPAGRELFARAARAYLAAVLDPGAREAPDRLAQRAAAAADRLVVRSDGLDARLLALERTVPWAPRLAAASAPPPPEGSADAQGPRSLCVRADAIAAWFATPCTSAPPADPLAPGGSAALDAQLDLALVNGGLQKLTPLDALQGGLPAALYAARLTVGGLLRGSGPLVLTGRPDAGGAEVELRWPLK